MKWLLTACVLILLLPIGMRAYWRDHNAAYQAGAVHGSDMAFVYFACMNKMELTPAWPTDQAIKDMVMYVNDPHSLSCEWFKQFKYD